MNNLTSKTIHGVSWNLIATISNTVLQIGYTAIMARLLTPSDFGLMAMAMVVIKFGDYFSKMGMSHALVQKPDLTNNDIRSVFTSSIAMGLFFTALMYFSAPLFQHVFDNENVIPVIELLSVNFLLKGLSMTALGLLGKELEFKKLALIDILCFVVCNMGIGIYLAYNDFGVYSLIYAGIFQQILMFGISFSLVRHDVRPLFSWQVYKPLLSFGSRKTAISFLEYIASSIDTFLIARFFGSVKLGLYNKARMLVFLPTYKLTMSVSKVLFPAFSKIQKDQSRLSKAYLSATTLISALLFPICLGMSIASKEIVLVVLGDQWTDAIPLLAILAFAVPFKLISNFGGILCDATAKLKIKLQFQIGYVVFLGGLFYLFRNYDLVVYPVIIFGAEFLRNLGYAVIAKNILGIRFFTVIKSYMPGVIIGIIVSFGLFAVTSALDLTQLPLLFKLIIQMTVGLILLLTFSLVFPFGPLREVLLDKSDTLSFRVGGKNIFQFFRWYKT